MPWEWARAAALPSEKLQAGIPLRFCFAWENQDNSSGLEPNQVFGPCIAAVPVLKKGN